MLGEMIGSAFGVLLLAASPDGTALAGSLALAPAPPTHAAASQLVRLSDGRRLNLHCTGEGSPTVLLEAGLMGWSMIWHKVQAAAAARSSTRVCAYDRAGMGFSDEAPTPRGIDMLAADLAALVEAAPLAPPLVLVGHSMGGLIVRRFAEEYPGKVAGMVLVDPSSEHQESRFAAIVPKEAASLDGAMAAVRSCHELADTAALAPDTPAYELCTNPFGLNLEGPLRKAQAERQLRPSQWRTIEAELKGMSDAHSALSGTRYGNMPMVVMTAEDNNLFPQLPADQQAASAALWRQMHGEMAALSSRGVHRLIPSSRHFIQLDQPESVISAIDQVVHWIRNQ